MTNITIIGNAKKAAGIVEDVDTYAGWGRRGKQVKKGSKALFKASIWKPSIKKAKSSKEGDSDDKDAIDGMYLVCAAFFGLSQTEDAK